MKTKIEKQKSQYKEQDFWIAFLIIFGWLSAVILGFVVWLGGWPGLGDFVYIPQLEAPSKASLTNFVFTTTLWAVAGNVAIHILEISNHIENFEVDLDLVQDLAEKNDDRETVESIKIRKQNFVNQGKDDILFLRPLFLPPLSVILAIPITFVFPGFRGGNVGIIVVSFLVGFIAWIFALRIKRRAVGHE